MDLSNRTIHTKYLRNHYNVAHSDLGIDLGPGLHRSVVASPDPLLQLQVVVGGFFDENLIVPIELPLGLFVRDSCRKGEPAAIILSAWSLQG